MQQDKPRVLVISHNAFSKVRNNGKTLESFFKGWDPDQIAQLFINADTPDFVFCHHYFNITDAQMVNHFLHRKTPGRELLPSDETPLKPEAPANQRKGVKSALRNLLYRMDKARLPIVSTARNTVWSKKRWMSDELMKWLTDFDPQIVFFQGSNSFFLYHIVEFICETYQIPLILELTDDYTYLNYPLSLLERSKQKKYLESFEKAIRYASKVITICDYMADEYKERFGGNYVSLLNSVPPVKETREDPTKIRFLYAGNVGIKRYQILCNIGKALANLNAEKGLSMTLDIYSPVGTPKSVIQKFNQIQTINYGGSLAADELSEEIQKSNYLVHVESFNRQMRKVTRLSLSTKIPEYLASHRCIFAVGPKDISSMKYLIDHNVAFVSTDKRVREIEKVIETMLSSKEQKTEKIANQKLLYEQNHQSDQTTSTILKIIQDAI